jgi:UMF1 family MFS transporter
MTRRSSLPALHEASRPRDVWAWAMYDFANSGYTTVVITALFNAYFVAVVAGGAPWATLAWTLTLSVSYFAVLVTAPVIGAYADMHAAKKKLLIVTTAGCVLFTALLYLGRPETLWLTVVFIALSNFFFSTGENLISAFLPELARSRGMGRVSGWGWGLGYLGGLLTLGACTAYIAWAEGAGQGAQQYVPASMLITAAIFALASLPTLLWLPERAVPQEGSLREAYREVVRTLKESARFPDLRRFLIAYLCFQAGVHTVIVLAAVYATQAMGFTTRETLLLIVVVNIAAAAGALSFGHFQDRVGEVRALALTLAGWIISLLLAWAATGPGMFWAAASLLGLCMGSSQAGSRALVGVLTPPSRRAEFFGFWGLTMKLSAMLGPPLYGVMVWATASNHRAALLANCVFFVLGLILLAGVRVGRGRRAAMLAERRGQGSRS